jgi:alpha-mannosidase
VAVEPLTGFRFAKVYTRRTRKEYATFMKALTELPRYVGELYFQAHRGTYTSQARTKARESSKRGVAARG